jgi:hypothetical protein
MQGGIVKPASEKRNGWHTVRLAAEPDGYGTVSFSEAEFTKAGLSVPTTPLAFRSFARLWFSPASLAWSYNSAWLSSH